MLIQVYRILCTRTCAAICTGWPKFKRVNHKLLTQRGKLVLHKCSGRMSYGCRLIISKNVHCTASAVIVHIKSCDGLKSWYSYSTFLPQEAVISVEAWSQRTKRFSLNWDSNDKSWSCSYWFAPVGQSGALTDVDIVSVAIRSVWKTCELRKVRQERQRTKTIHHTSHRFQKH